MNVSDWSDQTLVNGCLENNNIFRKALYDKYCDEMYTTAWHIVYDRDLASDILHDAFLQVFKDIKQLRVATSLKYWIKSIVVHTAIKVIKKQRLVHYSSDVEQPEPIIWPDPMSGEALQKAIGNLAEGYRVVFVLVEVEGYKHQEVAQMLGISEGTSKSQLFHAKRMLRKMLTTAAPGS